MDVPQLITSLGGTAAVVGALGYFLKHSFEKLLETRLKTIEERNKLVIEEDVKRRADLFDKRKDLYTTLATLIYRARNAARDAVSAIPSEQSAGAEETRDFDHETKRPIDRLRAYHDALTEMLYEERAYLPDHLFVLLHDAKHLFHALIHELDYRYSGRRRRGSKREIEEHIQRLDKHYEQVTIIVQKFLADGLQNNA